MVCQQKCLVQEAQVELEAAVVSISLPHNQHHTCVASFAVGSPARVDLAAGLVKPVPTVLLGELLPSAFLLHAVGATILVHPSHQPKHPRFQPCSS